MSRNCIRNYILPQDAETVFPGADGYVVCEQRPLWLGEGGILWYSRVGTIFASYSDAVAACQSTYEDSRKNLRPTMEFRIFGVARRA